MADVVRVGSLGKGKVRGVVKQVRVERPRPLKIGGGAHPELSLDDLLVVIEGVRKSLGVKGEHMVGQLQLISRLVVIVLKLVTKSVVFSSTDNIFYVFHPQGPTGQAEQLPHVGLQVGLLEPGGQGPHA